MQKAQPSGMGDFFQCLAGTLRVQGGRMEAKDVLQYLACSLGRTHEDPNIDLAVSLCRSKDAAAIAILADGLQSKKGGVPGDCIKVLYEIGYRKPELIADYVPDFVRLLRAKDNRLVWGGMTALARITHLKPAEVFAQLDIIMQAYETGSVITRDQSIRVFAELSRAGKEYEAAVFPVILRHLEKCRPKEIPQHAEQAFTAVNKDNAAAFANVLKKRTDLLTEAQNKRVNKLFQAIDGWRDGSRS